MKRFFSALLSLALIIAMLPTTAISAGTQQVSTEEDFWSAVADPAVTTIVLSGTVGLRRSDDSKDNAVVIGRAASPLTIQGGTLELMRAGIVLGGDVTFQNVSIAVNTAVRNAIIANGHSLTIDGVRSVGSYNISLFCGGVTDYNGGNADEIAGAATGDRGEITIRGTNDLGGGCIYAGSLSDVGNGVADSPNTFDGEAIVTVENGSEGVSTIYAHGAREDRSGGKPNNMLPDAGRYKVAGGVSVNLSNTPTVTVYGAAGDGKGANVVFTDSGSGYLARPLLSDVGSLTLSNAAANLRPQPINALTPVFADNADISLAGGGTLDLSELGDLALGSLAGGGTLVVGDSQKLTFTESVSGETHVAVGGTDYWGCSTGTIFPRHPYITAVGSGSGTFTLIPPEEESPLSLQKDNSGSWSVPMGAITAISLTGIQVDEGADYVEIPVAVTYDDTDSGLEAMYNVPANIRIGSVQAQREYGALGYYYTATVSGVELELFFDYGGSGSEILLIQTTDGSALPSGAYNISVAIPAAFSSVSLPAASAALTVGDALPPAPEPDDPVDPMRGNVYGRYVASSVIDVISVDIEWGSMRFAYSATGVQVWIPEDHNYNGSNGEGWYALDKNGDLLTITNHSNVDVQVTASGTPVNDGVIGVDFTVEKTGIADYEGDYVLQRGQEGKYDAADYLMLAAVPQGTLQDTETTLEKIADVTVTIAKYEAP